MQEEEDAVIHIDSQRTVPDSQEFDDYATHHDSHPQKSVEVPDSQKPSSLDANSGPKEITSERVEPSTEQSIASPGIPSRQPEEEVPSRVPSLTPDISVTCDREAEHTAAPVISESPFQPLFFTQDPEANYLPPSSSPVPESQPTAVDGSQAAQVVASIIPPPPQSSLDHSHHSSQDVIIPNTVYRSQRVDLLFENRLPQDSSEDIIPDSVIRRQPSLSQVAESRQSPVRPPLPFLNPLPSISSGFSTPTRLRTEQSPARSLSVQCSLPRSSGLYHSPSKMSSGTPRQSVREKLMEAAMSGFTSSKPKDDPILGQQQPADRTASEGQPIETGPTGALTFTAEAAVSAVPAMSESAAASDLSETLQPLIHITPEQESADQVSSVDPSAISIQPPQPSSVNTIDPLSVSFLAAEPIDSLPQTVSPSEISRSVEPEAIPVDQNLDIVIHDTELEEALPAQGSESSGQDESLSEGNEYLITLQMPANVMQLYVDTYYSYRTEIEAFSEARQEDLAVDPAVDAKIDGLLDQLYRICDYPGDLSPDAMRQLSPQKLARHASASNVKLFFAGQLMEKLVTSNKKVLVVARSKELIGYLEAIVLSIDDGTIPYSKIGLDEIKNQDSDPGLAVVLARADQEIKEPGDFDVVIAMDSSFSTSQVAKGLDGGKDKPMVLTLVNTFAIEHLDLATPSDMDTLTRKNATLVSLHKSMQYLSHFEDENSADSIAAQFANHILEPDMETFLDWKPQEIPQILLEYYDNMASTQPGATQPDAESVARKRKLVRDTKGRETEIWMYANLSQDDADDGVSKRPRRSSAQVDEVIQSQVNPDPAQEPANVTRAHVDDLEATIRHLKDELKKAEELEAIKDRQITNMATTIKSYEKTTNVVQKRLLEAQGERTAAEKARKVAEESAAGTASRLASLEEKYAALEVKYREGVLERSSQDATFADLTARTKELDDAQGKIQDFERRFKAKEDELEYARSTVQNERQSSRDVIQENQDLREKVQKLERERAQDLVKIHEINAANVQAEQQRQIQEALTTIRDRDAEIERLQEELRALKNGRRETRGVSAPRSPRMGVMSPRNGGRGGMSAMAGTGVSRGTSPLAGAFDQPPVGQLFPPVPNGRFNHLRDFP